MSEADELETRWPRVVGRFVLWGILAVVLYFLIAGPIYYLFGARSRTIEQGLWSFWTPIRWTYDLVDVSSYLDPYYQWWYTLPGGVQERHRQHPERGLWAAEMAEREKKLMDRR